MTKLLVAIEQALAYWPWLVVVPLAQFAHELTHFAVARHLGARPVIQIRLRTPMRVVYDDTAVSATGESYIGLAPTLAGLTAACAWLLVYGWPRATPVAVIVGVAWVLFTLPSRADVEAVAHWFAPDGGWGEPRRSVMIGLTVMAIGAWLPALPYPRGVTVNATIGIAIGAIAYVAVAFYEHGPPDDFV